MFCARVIVMKISLETVDGMTRSGRGLDSLVISWLSEIVPFISGI